MLSWGENARSTYVPYESLNSKAKQLGILVRAERIIANEETGYLETTAGRLYSTDHRKQNYTVLMQPIARMKASIEKEWNFNDGMRLFPDIICQLVTIAYFNEFFAVSPVAFAHDITHKTRDESMFTEFDRMNSLVDDKAEVPSIDYLEIERKKALEKPFRHLIGPLDENGEYVRQPYDPKLGDVRNYTTTRSNRERAWPQEPPFPAAFIESQWYSIDRQMDVLLIHPSGTFDTAETKKKMAMVRWLPTCNTTDHLSPEAIAGCLLQIHVQRWAPIMYLIYMKEISPQQPPAKPLCPTPFSEIFSKDRSGETVRRKGKTYIFKKMIRELCVAVTFVRKDTNERETRHIRADDAMRDFSLQFNEFIRSDRSIERPQVIKKRIFYELAQRSDVNHAVKNGLDNWLITRYAQEISKWNPNKKNTELLKGREY